MAKPKVVDDQISVKILVKDVQRIQDLKIHKTEPRWSVVERALDLLEKAKK